MLEPYVLKGTRTVLRREGGSNPVPTYPTGVMGEPKLVVTDRRETW